MSIFRRCPSEWKDRGKKLNNDELRELASDGDVSAEHELTRRLKRYSAAAKINKGNMKHDRRGKT